MAETNIATILKNSVQLWGKCPGCGEIHGDTQQIVSYLQWLANTGVIQFN